MKHYLNLQSLWQESHPDNQSTWGQKGQAPLTSHEPVGEEGMALSPSMDFGVEGQG